MAPIPHKPDYPRDRFMEAVRPRKVTKGWGCRQEGNEVIPGGR